MNTKSDGFASMLVLPIVATSIACAGPAGPPAPAGPASATVAYAHVLGNGMLDTARSKNVVAMAGGNGLYCFDLTFVPKNAVATLDNDPTAPKQGLGFVKVALPPTALFTCPTIPAPDATVMTANETAVGGGSSEGGWPFYVYWTE
jgi:hypothetical protein